MHTIHNWARGVNDNTHCVIGVRTNHIERFIYVKKGNNSNNGFFDEILQREVEVNSDNIGILMSCGQTVPLLGEDIAKFYSKQSPEFFEKSEQIFTRWYTEAKLYTGLFQIDTFNHIFGTNPNAYRTPLILCKHLGIDDKRDIEGESVDETTLNQCRVGWMKLIREHRNKNLQELDNLEKETLTSSLSSDIADIAIIKQMFRDVPQEVDLTQFKTVKALTSFWPSLLLPAPDFVCNES